MSFLMKYGERMFIRKNRVRKNGKRFYCIQARITRSDEKTKTLSKKRRKKWLTTLSTSTFRDTLFASSQVKFEQQSGKRPSVVVRFTFVDISVFDTLTLPSNMADNNSSCDVTASGLYGQKSEQAS